MSSSDLAPPLPSLEGLTLPELLDQLQDVALPAPVSLMPETLGWVVLGVVLLGLAGACLLLLFQRRRRNAYRRAALAELAVIEARAGAAPGTGEALTEIATLVRRTALAAFPRETVAHLHGEDWKGFLIRTAATTRPDDLDALIIGPYRPGAGADAARAARAARHWIERHHA